MHPEANEEHLRSVFLCVGVMMAGTTLAMIIMPEKVAWVLRLVTGAPAKVGVVGCRSRLRCKPSLDWKRDSLRKLIASFEYESSDERYKHV